jgi:acetyl esterase/lipase
MESIPVAHMGKFRVISVDYRQGYEHKFPAASEDVASVYSELLKDYSPSQIGIFGGSAGGMLAGQATAWILNEGLPKPGAIGIFGAGCGGSGDSAYFSAIGTGQSRPDETLEWILKGKVGYFSDTDPDDYLVNPNLAPEALRASFPPTLIITGTRSFDMSPAIATHRALVQAGADASLHVFDGLAHCFYYDERERIHGNAS